MMRGIKTVYNGIAFRSKLEAEWAMHFDELGIGYKYEPKTFGRYERYTPDFLIEDAFYVEIKPAGHLVPNRNIHMVDRPLFLISGHPSPKSCIVCKYSHLPDNPQIMVRFWARMTTNALDVIALDMIPIIGS